LKENFGVFVKSDRSTPEYEENKISCVIDAKGNPGMLAAPLAVNEAIKLGKKMYWDCRCKGYFNTTGSVSYYMENCQKDLIG